MAEPCRVVGVTAGRGGVGKTFVAVNFAIAVAEESRRRTLLLDLNLPYSGDTLLLLGQSQAPSMQQLMPQSGRMTPDVLRQGIWKHSSGVAVLPANLKAGEEAPFTPEEFSTFFDKLTLAYDFIVVDLGDDLGELQLEVLDHAFRCLTIVTPEIIALHQSKRCLDRLQSLLFSRQSTRLVLNKFEEGCAITRNIIEMNLKLAAAAVLPRADKEVGESFLSGTPFLASQGRHEITRALRALAREVVVDTFMLAKGKRQGLARKGGLAVAGAVPAPASGTVPAGGPAVPPVAPYSGKRRDDVVQLKLRIHKRLIAEMDLRTLDLNSQKDDGKRQELQDRTAKMLAKLIDEEAPEQMSRDERRLIARELFNEALGLGCLEELLKDPNVSEIMVNRADRIYVEHKGKLTLSDAYFSNEEQLRRIIERIVVPIGRRVDEKSPLVDARLPTGERVNAIIPPLALDGSILTIRKFSKTPLKVPDLIRFGSMNEQMARFLHATVLARKNIIISGGTGSGKTTLLNVLSNFIPHDERIVTVEDSAELQLQQEHVCRLETRPPNIEGAGEVTIRDLVKNCLRMRPDRIVVGECRGGESLDMLQAMNTGHDGSLTTLHANTPRDALSRLETMVMMSGMELPSKAIREQIAAAVNVIVQQSRLSDGSRRVTYITEITGMEGNTFTTQDIFVYKQTGVGADGKIIGRHTPTGNIPSFVEELSRKGIDVPREIFLQHAG